MPCPNSTQIEEPTDRAWRWRRLEVEIGITLSDRSSIDRTRRLLHARRGVLSYETTRDLRKIRSPAPRALLHILDNPVEIWGPTLLFKVRPPPGEGQHVTTTRKPFDCPLRHGSMEQSGEKNPSHHPRTPLPTFPRAPRSGKSTSNVGGCSIEPCYDLLTSPTSTLEERKPPAIFSTERGTGPSWTIS